MYVSLYTYVLVVLLSPCSDRREVDLVVVFYQDGKVGRDGERTVRLFWAVNVISYAGRGGRGA